MRDGTRSYPIIDPRDDPSAESPAEREARLLAARSIDSRLEEHENRIDAIERRHQAEDAALSDPVTLKGPGGWTVSGRGWYVLAIAALAVAAFFGWLVLK